MLINIHQFCMVSIVQAHFSANTQTMRPNIGVLAWTWLTRPLSSSEVATILRRDGSENVPKDHYDDLPTCTRRQSNATTRSKSDRDSWDRSRNSGGFQECWSTFEPETLVCQDRDPFARCSEDEEVEPPVRSGRANGGRSNSDSRTLQALGVANKVADFQQSSLFAVPSGVDQHERERTRSLSLPVYLSR